MKFTPTDIPGVMIVEPEPVADARGFFARLWCPREFERQGLDPRLAQCSMSYNPRRGTIRGLHYQAEPFAEAKLVRCGRGGIWDVALDLRPDSPTYTHSVRMELSAENGRMLYIPAGCAHGFQTLADHAEVFYYITEFYQPELARGVRWNDPAFGISWPLPLTAISDRDANHPDFVPSPAHHAGS
ncbi:MAG: dTDP-4-dehydrorhamnose 3,5-epimerase [Planctomycetes bacterium]|nr:dTDP-4-dehydrorhamnose 3,5-epimerase [Planctomycetota bacterium]